MATSNYLTYSPSVEAYVDCAAGSKHTYYDLTQDIVECNVNRVIDDSSTFSITLSNKNRKYNGLFSAMDRITIFATKTERYQLLTGYITDVDVFTLYADDFHISGRCSLYHAQELYWDPLLKESQDLIASSYDKAWKDGGYWQAVYGMLMKVGGWSSDSINISANFPQQVVDWAMKMYKTQKNDLKQATATIEAFDKMLKQHGPKFASVDSLSFDGSGLTGDEANASDEQKAIVAKAKDGSVTQGVDMCLAWVGDVYQAAGYPFQRWWGAIEVWRQRQGQTAYGKGQSGIPLGACVVSTGTGAYGAGHIGIYIGGGNVISWLGYNAKIETVKSFGDWAYGNIDNMKGWVGWVCPKTSPQINWK